MTNNAINIDASGIAVFSASTGDFSYVDLTAKGDLITHTGAAYSKTALGSDNTILKANSAAASGLSWSSITYTGSRVLISSQTASNATSIDFTGLDFATYEIIRFNFYSLHPATDSVNLQMLYSTDNGATWLSSNYAWAYRTVDDTGAGGENHSASDAKIELCASVGSAAGEGLSGWVLLLPSDDTANAFKYSSEWQVVEQDSTTKLIGQWGGGYNTTTSDVNAIRFKFSSGNIEAGSIYMYGWEGS